MTVCRQLNLGYASRAVTKKNLFGGKILGMIMSGVKCRVDEISIYNWRHDEWRSTTCSSQENPAGVICVDGEVWRVQEEYLLNSFRLCLEIRPLAGNASVVCLSPFSPVQQADCPHVLLVSPSVSRDKSSS